MVSTGTGNLVVSVEKRPFLKKILSAVTMYFCEI